KADRRRSSTTEMASKSPNSPSSPRRNSLRGLIASPLRPFRVHRSSQGASTPKAAYSPNHQNAPIGIHTRIVSPVLVLGTIMGECGCSVQCNWCIFNDLGNRCCDPSHRNLGIQADLRATRPHHCGPRGCLGCYSQEIVPVALYHPLSPQ